MPAFFWAFIFVAIIGVVWLGLTRFASRSTRQANRVAAFTVLGFAALFFLLSCFTIVGTQNIGVLTAFGHPDGALTNGLHVKWPWQQVTKIDGRIQTDTYASNGYNGSVQQNAIDGCVNVRIARQATACVNVTVRWQNKKSGIDYLFRNYQTNDNVRDQLLHRDLQTAVNVAFSHYDPLGLNANGDSTQPTAAQLAGGVQTSLQQQVGQYLNVIKVFIPLFNFDPDTQKRLNQLQLQVAQTRIAQQAEQTAQAQAAANRQLAASVSHDPNVLVSKCLDILNEAVTRGQNLPAGFSCFGAGSPVAVAAK